MCTSDKCWYFSSQRSVGFTTGLKCKLCNVWGKNNGITCKSKSALLSILPHVPYIHTENLNCVTLFTPSEFRGAWDKRGEGGQGREGVQLPDSLMDEAVLQSVGPRLETTQSPPWWQQTEEAVCRVGGMSWREGRETPTIFSAALTIRWRDLRQDALQAPYHTVMQLVRMLSMVPL